MALFLRVLAADACTIAQCTKPGNNMPLSRLESRLNFPMQSSGADHAINHKISYSSNLIGAPTADDMLLV